MPNIQPKYYKDALALNGIVDKSFEFPMWKFNPDISKPYAYVSSKQSGAISDDDSLIYFGLFVEDKIWTELNADPDTSSDLSADGNNHAYSVDVLTPPVDIESQYNDITRDIRIVNDNVKICPNNSEKGSWIHENIPYSDNARKVRWESIDNVYPMVFQREGYMDTSAVPGPTGIHGYLDLTGWQKLWSENLGLIDCYHGDNNCGIFFNGMLTFPYGPAIIMMNDTPQDNYGPFYVDMNETDDGQGSGDDHARYYTKRGKILGSTTDKTMGMISVLSNGYIDPSDSGWSSVPAIDNSDTGDNS